MHACLTSLAFLSYRVIPRGTRYSAWGYPAATGCPCCGWLACPAMRVRKDKQQQIHQLTAQYFGLWDCREVNVRHSQPWDPWRPELFLYYCYTQCPVRAPQARTRKGHLK